MKKILMFACVLGAMSMYSCKEKGCTDPTATNYNESAKKDDGSCTYDEGNQDQIDISSNPSFSMKIDGVSHSKKSTLFSQTIAYVGMSSGVDDYHAYHSSLEDGMTGKLEIKVSRNFFHDDWSVPFPEPSADMFTLGNKVLQFMTDVDDSYVIAFETEDGTYYTSSLAAQPGNHSFKIIDHKAVTTSGVAGFKVLFKFNNVQVASIMDSNDTKKITDGTFVGIFQY